MLWLLELIEKVQLLGLMGMLLLLGTVIKASAFGGS